MKSLTITLASALLIIAAASCSKPSASEAADATRIALRSGDIATAFRSVESATEIEATTDNWRDLLDMSVMSMQIADADASVGDIATALNIYERVAAAIPADSLQAYMLEAPVDDAQQLATLANLSAARNIATEIGEYEQPDDTEEQCTDTAEQTADNEPANL